MKNQLLNLKMIALMCLMMVLGGANVWAQETVTIWSEDWTGQTVGATPSSINSMYSQGNNSTVISSDNLAAGGKAPELLLKANDKWTIKISDLKGCSGELTLCFHTNRNPKDDKPISVTANGNSIKLSVDESDNKLCTGTFSVEEGTSNVTIVFNATKNARIDDVVLTGIKAQTKKLTSLAISGQPTKKTYNVGEEFDPTGLVVTGTYEDNTTATITNGITWTKNPEKMSLGNTSCTVTASVGEVKSEPFVVNGLNVVRTISLSIDPTTSTVVKAPVNVTLTAPEGATVYYTTNGDEPTTSSTKYTTPFDVTVSGTTVKALAVAEGAENVKAEATYTIKPDQPLFSDESKTFKDAFNVTLSLPESTDATSEIHYAIGAKATASSPKYEAPINISAENDGDKVILHAVVVDKYGNIGAEKVCTYTKSNAIVFDFTSDWEGITATAAANNQKDGEQVVTGKELNVEGVVMTATNGEDSNNKTYFTGLYKNNDGQNLRVYINGSLTFTAPEGYNLSKISFTGDKFIVKSDKKFSATEKELTISNASSATWTGNAHAVTFNAFAGVQFETATIKLVAAAAKPTYTKQNLKFIAYTSEGYYATFSSDKVTFITSKHVIPHVVTVANGKIDMKSDMFKSEKTTIESAEVDGYYIPANTGILLYSDADNADYYTVENKTVDALAKGTNMLKPAPANGGEFTAENDYKYYKLAYNDYDKHEGLGFYWGADNGGAFYVKAGTAYLAVPEAIAVSAKGFTLNGEATGIEGVNANVENAKAIYNLNGQRVASMAKPGLYIVNGKKVVRK